MGEIDLEKKIRKVTGYDIELIYGIEERAFPDYCWIKGHISSELETSSIKKTLVIELVNAIIDFTLFRKFGNKVNVLKKMAINSFFDIKVMVKYLF